MARKLAMVFGLILLVIGFLGFVNNSMFGRGGFFVTSILHSMVHILLGIVLLLGAKTAQATLKIVAAVYLFAAILGFVMGEGKLLFGLFTINTPDNWLHLVFAIVLFGASQVGNPSSTSKSV